MKSNNTNAALVSEQQEPVASSTGTEHFSTPPHQIWPFCITEPAAGATAGSNDLTRRYHEQRVDWRLGGESACGPNREMLCKRGVRKRGTRIQTCGVRLVCFGCCCGSGFWPLGVLGALALGHPGVCPVGNPVGGSGREARGGSLKKY